MNAAPDQEQKADGTLGRTTGEHNDDSLTTRAARGFMWMIAQTVVIKSFDTVAHLILGWLLLGDEWGVIGLAMAVRAFTDVLRRTGLRQVLVQRARHFDRWATPAFWMAATIAVVFMGLMVAAAPMIASIYEEPRLVAMMMVLAIVPPIGAVGMVPVAKLQADMRFRALALSDTSCRIVQIGFRVGLVIAGMGPLGYILAEPISEVGRTTLYWILARPKIRPKAQWRRWRFLLADSGWMFLATNANKLVEQADKLVLGLYHDKPVVGAYFWAYMISRQTIDVFVWNLEKILLPALSKIQLEPKRQVAAFLRSCRLLAVLVIPGCFLLASVIDPLLKLIYPGQQRWDSIPVVQIVSAAMSMWVLYGPTSSLIKAQGRFKLFMLITWAYAIFFTIVITVTAWLSHLFDRNGATTMAVAVGVCMAMFGPIQAYIGIKPGGGTWKDVSGIYIPPMILGIFSVGPATVLANTLPYISESHLLRLLFITFVGGVCYLALLRMAMREMWFTLIQQVRSIGPSSRTT